MNPAEATGGAPSATPSKRAIAIALRRVLSDSPTRPIVQPRVRAYERSPTIRGARVVDISGDPRKEPRGGPEGRAGRGSSELFSIAGTRRALPLKRCGAS